MLETSPLVSKVTVSMTSPKSPAVDITSNIFLRDSGTASDYMGKERRESGSEGERG